MAHPWNQRIEELFHQAVELPKDRRGAFLDDQCGDDAELRAALEIFLENDDDAERDGLFRSPVAARRPALSLSEAVPLRIGRYRVLRRIGEGGMGVVHEAEQDNPRRIVALKFMRAGVVSKEFIRRFQREVQIQSRLNHVGIAQVFDADLHDGQPYFAMEYVCGTPLNEFAARHKLNLQQRLELVALVCDAVQHAHEHGVIHRDLKPANILIEESGQPKVLDFGVARILDEDLKAATMRTEAGQLIGTLSYMSPEQFVSNSEGIGVRSDVYALGVILFELLAGRLPYQLTGLSLPEMSRVMSERDVPRLGSVDRQFRGDVEIIVAKALEKDGALRHASAAELGAEIRRYLRGEPIHSRPPSATYYLRKFVRRNKLLVGGIVALLLTLVVGSIGTTVFAIRETRQRRIAESNAQIARDNERKARQESYRARIALAVAAVESHNVADAARQLELAPAELCDWEWHHLSSRLDDSSVMFQAPRDSGMSMFVGPDGPRIVIGNSEDLRALDENGRIVLRLPRDRWPNVRFIGQSTAGHWVFTEQNQFCRLSATGDVVSTLILPPDVPANLIGGFASNHDSTRIALGGFYNKEPLIRNEFLVLDGDSGRRLGTFVGHEDRITALTFSPDGNRIASTSEDGTARIWDISGNASPIVLRGHLLKANSPVFRADGARLLTCSADGTVRQWDTRTGQQIDSAFERHTGEVFTAVYSPDGNWIASAGTDRTIRVWRATGREVPLVFHGHTDDVLELAFSQDGSRLISVAKDRTTRIWELAENSKSTVLRGHGSYVYPVSFSPDGHWIASGSWDRTVRLWDAQSGESRAVLSHSGVVRTLAISPDGTWLVSGCDSDSQFYVWDIETSQLRRRIPGSTDSLRAVAIHPDGQSMASLDEQGQLRITDVKSGTVIASARLALPLTRGTLAYSPNGRMLAVACEGGKVGVWDARTNRLVSQWSGHSGPVYSVAFSSDGRRLVSASQDQTARVWDVETGTCLSVLRGHSGELFTAVFHPRGTRIATGGRDRMVWLWDAELGLEVARLQGHTNYVFSLAFSRDGTNLSSGSGDGTVRLWRTEHGSNRRILTEKGSK